MVTHQSLVEVEVKSNWVFQLILIYIFQGVSKV